MSDVECESAARTMQLTAMHAEYLVVNHHGQSEEIEHVREVGPNMRRAILPYTLRVEAVCL